MPGRRLRESPYEDLWRERRMLVGAIDTHPDRWRGFDNDGYRSRIEAIDARIARMAARDRAAEQRAENVRQHRQDIIIKLVASGLSVEDAAKKADEILRA